MRFEDLTSEQVRQIAEFEALCEAQARPALQIGMTAYQNGVEVRIDRIISDTEVVISRPWKRSKFGSRYAWTQPISMLTFVK